MFASGCPRPAAGRWPLAAGLSVLLHLCLLLSVYVPGISLAPPLPQPRLTLDFSAAPPELEVAQAGSGSETRPQEPAPALQPQLTPAAPPEPPQPQPAARSEPEPPAPPVERKAPEPQPAAPPKPEDFEPELQVAMADDTAKGQDQPPDNPKYLGATNTQAADRSAKLRIGEDPHQDGESVEVRFAGRRGETGRPAERQAPGMGSVAREGDSPLPVERSSPRQAPPPREPVPPQASQQRPQPEQAAAPLPPPVPKVPGRPAMAVPKTGGQTVVIVPLAGDLVKPGDRFLIRRDGQVIGEAELVRRDPDQCAAVVRECKVGKVATGDELVRTGPNGEVLSSTPITRVAPEVSAPGPSMDPELARVIALLRQTPADAAAGPGARPGQPGEEGDGRVRPGELDAISDVVSAQMDSAAQEGDVAFSKMAVPELAYLKPFFRHMDGKWKAILYSDARQLSRIELGNVKVRFTLGRDGKLLEVAEVGRKGTLSDRAVQACLEGIRQATPHAPFPASLGGREKLTHTIQFLYR